MFNIFSDIIEFITKFWSVLPQPVTALFAAFLGTFVVVQSFMLVWRLH